MRHPSILEAIAQSASEDAIDRIVTWLGDCPIKGKDGTGEEICERAAVLILDATRIPHALRRFFKFVDETDYKSSRKLLERERVTLREPSFSTLSDIINARDLTQDEAVALLRFLQDNKRWRTYDELQEDLRGHWYPGPNGRVSIADASEAGLVDADVPSEPEFKAWLGFRQTAAVQIQVPPPPPPPPRRKEPKQILIDLHDWWQDKGLSWTAAFERRFFGSGGKPNLLSDPDPEDFPQRKHWLRLFLVGAYQTGGRKKPEHHEGFLDRCERNNWLDTFARRESNAQDWVDVLESYLDQPTSDMLYYDDFARLFVRIFHLSRWLEHYVRSFCSIRTRPPPWNLNQILSTREDPTGGGGGPDAPSVRRNLGIGACFVVRELCRLRVVSSKEKYEHRYCYVPSERIRLLLESIANETLFGTGDTPAERSVRIFEFLKDQIGPAKATFDNSFDLPLIALSEDAELQEQMMGRAIPSWSDDGRDRRYNSYRDEGWRTLPDGRRIKLNL